MALRIRTFMYWYHFLAEILYPKPQARKRNCPPTRNFFEAQISEILKG